MFLNLTKGIKNIYNKVEIVGHIVNFSKHRDELFCMYHDFEPIALTSL